MPSDEGVPKHAGECPERAETAPIGFARQGPLTCPLATFAVAIYNGSFTSIRDIQSVATNVRSESEAEIQTDPLPDGAGKARENVYPRCLPKNSSVRDQASAALGAS